MTCGERNESNEETKTALTLRMEIYLTQHVAQKQPEISNFDLAVNRSAVKNRIFLPSENVIYKNQPIKGIKVRQNGRRES